MNHKSSRTPSRPWRRSLLLPASTSVLVLATCLNPSFAATSGANGTHDPSRMITCEGRFYVYSTGGGSKSSADGLSWTSGPGLFPGGIPTSATSVVSNNEGVWAPDAIYLNGQYYIYYALANSNNDCAVGLITTPTLNPSSPNYKITDHGVVVSNTGSDTYCAIDPAPILDASGKLWLSWGSGYTKSSSDNTIYLTLLDNKTGLPSSADSAKPGHPLEPGHIEASYVYSRAGYYYLFWNSGGCCDGASSTYEIHVARATDITGPYTGSRIFYASNGSVHGPGQIGIYDQCGASRFTYHYYPDTGGSILGENELTWSSDGWPVAGASSTTPLTVCSGTGTGGTGGTGTGGASGTGGAAGGSKGTGGTVGTGGVGGDSGSGGRGSGRDAGTADASGAGGTLAGTGGSSGGLTGGSSGTGGRSGTGGYDTSTGGMTGIAGNGMSAGSSGAMGGSTGSGGLATGGSSDSGSSGGCSCAVGGHPGTGLAMGAFALALAISRARRGRRSIR